jgi:hypothetical protein
VEKFNVQETWHIGAYLMINMDVLNALYKSTSEQLIRILEPTPQTIRPVVTQSAADSGFIVRYFIRQVNDKTFVVEVDKNQYERFRENPRFIGVEVKWKIIGKLETTKLPNGINLFGVKDQNRITVADADLTFGGLRNYITDYGEFWLREN